MLWGSLGHLIFIYLLSPQQVPFASVCLPDTCTPEAPMEDAPDDVEAAPWTWQLYAPVGLDLGILVSHCVINSEITRNMYILGFLDIFGRFRSWDLSLQLT